MTPDEENAAEALEQLARERDRYASAVDADDPRPATQAQARALEEEADHLRLGARALRVKGMLVEALEAIETRLKECSHSLPGGNTPERVVAKTGAVPIDSTILAQCLRALAEARKEPT